MLRSIERALALVVAACCASSVVAQDAELDLRPQNPVRVTEDGDEILLGTSPLPGYYVSGLFRVRGSSDSLEVLRPHDPSSPTIWFPRVWLRTAGEGSFVGVDLGSLWRLDATGPERLITPLDGSNAFNTDLVGEARGVVYYSPQSSTYGTELWRTDGTADGTWLVRDIAPGSTSSSPRYGVTMGSVLFFPATTAEHGRELWRSDGTDAGTVRVVELRPGPESADPVLLGRLGETLVFTASRVDQRSTLWTTDGSREGTRAVLDLDVYVEPATRVGRLGDVLIFADTSGARWRTDGTAEGTFPLLSAGVTGGPIVSGGRAWLTRHGDVGDRGVWVTDGTSQGTRRVWTPPDTDRSSWVGDSVALAGGLAFRAVTEAEGPSLWFTDGTTEETTLLAGHSTGVSVYMGSSQPNTYYFGMLASTGEAAWFAAGGEAGWPFWITDGTVDGTRPVDLTGITDEPEYPAPSPLEPFADPGPVGPEPAPPDGADIEPEPLEVKKLRIDLHLDGDVDLRLRCRLPLAGERGVEGETIVIDVGGIVSDVVLDSRGRARTTDGRRVKTRLQRGRRDTPDMLRVELRLRRAPVAAQLFDEGLSLPKGASQVDRDIDVEIRWRDLLHVSESMIRYRQRRNRGIAKLLD